MATFRLDGVPTNEVPEGVDQVPTDAQTWPLTEAATAARAGYVVDRPVGAAIRLPDRPQAATAFRADVRPAVARVRAAGVRSARARTPHTVVVLGVIDGALSDAVLASDAGVEIDVRLEAGLAEDPSPVLVAIPAVMGVAPAVRPAEGTGRPKVGLVDDLGWCGCVPLSRYKFRF